MLEAPVGDVEAPVELLSAPETFARLLLYVEDNVTVAFSGAAIAVSRVKRVTESTLWFAARAQAHALPSSPVPRMVAVLMSTGRLFEQKRKDGGMKQAWPLRGEGGQAGKQARAGAVHQ